ncbi:hypothetical protein E1264_08525 [Actinomadura sp. KC216]|uniref:FHA domain-containing protein n=1 Tax=Actinomadura sp. KC216 TaxID=2530370 RepID=UPI0010481074|nr:FHA domain-containing protein [Actinomadura sp. KC216]TDB89380.1 hypothetical protein E1264_08525 [Actinomadura sp. KC216]
MVDTDDPDDDGAVVVSGPLGPPRLLRPGDRLTFGRGPEVDLPLGPDDRWMSKRAGEIAVDGDGVRVVNLSRKHALVIQSGDYEPGDPAPPLREPVTLRPRLPEDPAEACVLTAGSALVGSALMLRELRAVHVRLPGPGPAADPVLPGGSGRRSSTVAGITMNPETREFMVALQLCAPWLRNTARVDRLPTEPEIGPLALESVGETYLARRARNDPELRDRLQKKVHDHLKALRKKLVARTLLPKEGTLGNTAIASTILLYDILGHRHLALFENAYWKQVQANQWARCLE